MSQVDKRTDCHLSAGAGAGATSHRLASHRISYHLIGQLLLVHALKKTPTPPLQPTGELRPLVGVTIWPYY